MIACFRRPAILCRRLIAGVAAVTYMAARREIKSDNAPKAGPEVNDGVE
jgi:hypothetical protein